MNRRSNAIRGCVRFPVDDPNWINSREGGMVVKLVALEPPEVPEGRQFGVCCGAYVVDQLSEELVGDDRRPFPADPDEVASTTKHGFLAALKAYEEAVAQWKRYHFPNLGDYREPWREFVSAPYLASLVLGSTGWSGTHVQTREPWRCSLEDLTDEGRALYAQLQALYPSAELHLLTFLDT